MPRPPFPPRVVAVDGQGPSRGDHLTIPVDRASGHRPRPAPRQRWVHAPVGPTDRRSLGLPQPYRTQGQRQGLQARPTDTDPDQTKPHRVGPENHLTRNGRGRDTQGRAQPSESRPRGTRSATPDVSTPVMDPDTHRRRQGTSQDVNPHTGHRGESERRGTTGTRARRSQRSAPAPALRGRNSEPLRPTFRTRGDDGGPSLSTVRVGRSQEGRASERLSVRHLIPKSWHTQ